MLTEIPKGCYTCIEVRCQINLPYQLLLMSVSSMKMTKFVQMAAHLEMNYKFNNNKINDPNKHTESTL